MEWIGISCMVLRVTAVDDAQPDSLFAVRHLQVDYQAVDGDYGKTGYRQRRASLMLCLFAHTATFLKSFPASAVPA
jgi:hypothetical protein